MWLIIKVVLVMNSYVDPTLFSKKNLSLIFSCKGFFFFFFFHTHKIKIKTSTFRMERLIYTCPYQKLDTFFSLFWKEDAWYLLSLIFIISYISFGKKLVWYFNHAHLSNYNDMNIQRSRHKKMSRANRLQCHVRWA